MARFRIKSTVLTLLLLGSLNSPCTYAGKTAAQKMTPEEQELFVSEIGKYFQGLLAQWDGEVIRWKNLETNGPEVTGDPATDRVFQESWEDAKSHCYNSIENISAKLIKVFKKFSTGHISEEKIEEAIDQLENSDSLDKLVDYFQEACEKRTPKTKPRPKRKKKLVNKAKQKDSEPPQDLLDSSLMDGGIGDIIWGEVNKPLRPEVAHDASAPPLNDQTEQSSISGNSNPWATNEPVTFKQPPVNPSYQFKFPVAQPTAPSLDALSQNPELQRQYEDAKEEADRLEKERKEQEDPFFRTLNPLANKGVQEYLGRLKEVPKPAPSQNVVEAVKLPQEEESIVEEAISKEKDQEFAPEVQEVQAPCPTSTFSLPPPPPALISLDAQATEQQPQQIKQPLNLPPPPSSEIEAHGVESQPAVLQALRPANSHEPTNPFINTENEGEKEEREVVLRDLGMWKLPGGDELGNLLKKNGSKVDP